jgi:hypothetical protein
MSYSVGDGMVAVALAAGVVGYLYVKHLGRSKRLEVIHQERLIAMEKGIPLPEFPLDPPQTPSVPNPHVTAMVGMMLMCFSVGTMILLYRVLDADSRAFWIAPLPVAFMGLGLLAIHFVKMHDGR